MLNWKVAKVVLLDLAFTQPRHVPKHQPSIDWKATTSTDAKALRHRLFVAFFHTKNEFLLLECSCMEDSCNDT
jgi:hypothetical protein